jgi:hypothetical protein
MPLHSFLMFLMSAAIMMPLDIHIKYFVQRNLSNILKVMLKFLMTNIQREMKTSNKLKGYFMKIMLHSQLLLSIQRYAHSYTSFTASTVMQ